MQLLASLFPLIIVLLDLIIMAMCLRHISNRTNFNHLNKNAWIFIVIFGSFIGQIAYLFLEIAE
jgi:hypothetical protein